MLSVARPVRLAATTRPHVQAGNYLSRSRIRVRYQSGSTSGDGLRYGWPSMIVAGAAGGGVVFLAGFTYYHLSGIKGTVDKVTSIVHLFKRSQPSTVDNAPESTKEILNFLRSVAKTYAQNMPGATFLVDLCFDAVDQLHTTNRGEVDRILQKAYNDVKTVLADASRAGMAGIQSLNGDKLMHIFSHLLMELSGLAQRTGSDAFAKLREHYATDATRQWDTVSKSLLALANHQRELTDSINTIMLESSKIARDGELPPENVLETALKTVKSSVKQVKEALTGKQRAHDQEAPPAISDSEREFISTHILSRAVELLKRLEAVSNGPEERLLGAKLAAMRQAKESHSGSWEEIAQSMSIEDEKETLQAMDKMWQILAEVRDELTVLQTEEAAFVQRLRQQQNAEDRTKTSRSSKSDPSP